MQILSIYLSLINALALLLMLADKQRAKKHRWRIPESVLLASAALGGSLGALLGMWLFRHKTRKAKFFAIDMMALSCLFMFWQFPERWWMGAVSSVFCSCVAVWMWLRPEA